MWGLSTRLCNIVEVIICFGGLGNEGRPRLHVAENPVARTGEGLCSGLHLAGGPRQRYRGRDPLVGDRDGWVFFRSGRPDTIFEIQICKLLVQDCHHFLKL